ncbi:kinase-like protein [Xylariaceae sp. FL0662B]|nr:kinase-like protein [Xylariaceae sp. FL0662B]
MSSQETNRVRLLMMERAKATGQPIPPRPGIPPQRIPGKVLLNTGPRQVIQHGDKVTKFIFPGTSCSEVAAMRFVREHTSIPIPLVHDATDESITMEFVEGVTLQEAWGKLSEAERSSISAQLRGYIEQMRDIDTGRARIGAVDGGPAIDAHMLGRHQGGPFTCEAEWNDFLLEGLHEDTPRAIRRMCQSQLRTDHKLVFTHGDLHATNILVSDGRIVALLDWEFAGFYPEYVELTTSLRGANWKVGYYDALLDIFPCRYDAEYVIDDLMDDFSKHS